MIRKVKETGEVDEDGNPIQLSDVEKEGDGGIGDEGILEGRIQSPKQEIKEELKELSTPKRKRAVKPKGKAVKPEESLVPETVDIKPEVGEEAVNNAVDEAEPEVKAKAPPKKRARKSKDTAEA
jgi:hypothetical protein